MSNTPQTPAPSGNFGPSLADRLSPSIDRFGQLQDKIFQSLRVAVPAIVKAFYPGPPATVDVQMAITEKFQFNLNGPNASASNPVNIQVQQMTPGSLDQGKGILAGLPVFILGAGGWSATFPIQEGDECLIVFTDTNIDSWFQSGGLQNPIDSRRHELSDGIAIFGLRSKPNGLQDYSTDSAQLRSDDGSVIIDLADDGVTITAPNLTIKVTGTVEIDCPNTIMSGMLSVAKKFGCNGKSPQGSATSNGPLTVTPSNISPWGCATEPQFQQLVNLVSAIRMALVENGIMQ